MSNTNNTSNTGNKLRPFGYRLVTVLTVMILGLPLRLTAQVPRDIPTVEAYINDHKKQRSLLLARSVLEESNQLLHKTSEATHRQYRDINIELDKYTRAFDIIDLVYSTVSTGFNVYRTYDDVSDKLGKYKALLSEYNDKIIKRRRIESADTLLDRQRQSCQKPQCGVPQPLFVRFRPCRLCQRSCQLHARLDDADGREHQQVA